MKLTVKFGVLLLMMASACSALATDVERQNLEKMRQEIGVFESVLNQNLTQIFPGPFGYLDRARGAYLPGYGVVFTFEVNLLPQPLSLGPFSPAAGERDAQKDRAEQKKRRDVAKEMCERVLADFGHTLTLGSNESVAIAVHGSAAGSQGIEKSTIVLRAPKQAIEDYRAKKLDRAAFNAKIEVLEY